MNSTQFDTERVIGPFNEVESKNAPSSLYSIGDITYLTNYPIVSIVGSRDASPEGLARARALAKMLTEVGVVVLSGMALGIDSAAHLSAIESGGRTIAVLGTSVDQCYPKSNIELYQAIAKDHLVLSQFPTGYPSKKSNFPMRNRTMALISHATVIVEARDKSGSLHQGWEALRLGRPLFVLRSNFENKNISWPNELYQYGAQPLDKHTFDSLVEELPSHHSKEHDELTL